MVGICINPACGREKQCYDVIKGILRMVVEVGAPVGCEYYSMNSTTAQPLVEEIGC